MGEKRNWIKEFLEWAHHAYWIREFLISSGIAAAVMKWLVSHVAVLSQYGWAIWFLLAGLLMYASDAWRRRRGLEKEPNPQSALAQVGAKGEGDVLPPGVDINAWFRHAYRTNCEDEVRKNFRILAHQESPDDPESFYLKFLGVGFIAAMYDGTWWPLYRSQLLAMIELNRNNGYLPISRAREFYDSAVREHPEEYKTTTFDQWLSYLIENKLLIRHPSDMLEITIKGKDFLKYLTHWGRGPDQKRL